MHLGGEHIDLHSNQRLFESLKVSAKCRVFYFDRKRGADLVVIDFDVDFAGEIVCICSRRFARISPRLLRSGSLLSRALSLAFVYGVLIRLVVRIIVAWFFRLELIRVGLIGAGSVVG